MVRLFAFALFFLSGAAALVYQVAWARSLGLVFGASHLAVATVLAVFMAGQALGSVLLGSRADRAERPLRIYGWLELGIGAAGALFIAIIAIYPHVYAPVARLAERNGAWLTLVRATLAVVAMIIPTTLMGATLPVLARSFASRGALFADRLSVLYAFNTLGAVAGSFTAGFLLLRTLGVTRTLLVAISTSVAVGIGALILDRWFAPAELAPHEGSSSGPATGDDAGRSSWRRLALVGTAVSGFCALGYEVLWTRMLTLVVGTSVYSFTIMLVAILCGIGIGSHAFPLTRRLRATARGEVLFLAGTQLAIGASALVATVLMRDLPTVARSLQLALLGVSSSEFSGRLAASAAVAFVYMFVPAFFMGLAFPAAGAVWSSGRRDHAGAVGRLLAANTTGAIAGSLLAGFVLIHLFQIERSLQMLVIVNLAMGLVLVAGAFRARSLIFAVSATALALLVARGAVVERGRAWDRRYFATFVNNSRTAPDRVRIAEELGDVEVLYYNEGANSTASVTRRKGSHQAFIVNGRPEASSAPIDMQLQYSLGHLPMLLHPAPRTVFVLGTGSGMTLGATSLHRTVERIVLAEIEEGVLGVARTFSPWNHGVLDDPRLEVVFNDGRNFLATTRERFDVITADPIHPWSGGAGYLYTREYFRSIGERLAPGGVASQWLPLYELTTRDVKTVVRTFAESFPHVMVWITYYDAVLIGSNEPIFIDEAELARRLAVPAVRSDLERVHMGSVEALLSYFLTGRDGALEFGSGADVNTDDNLVLEFSAPESQGITGLDAANLMALSSVRESVVSYLRPAPEGARRERWERLHEAGLLFGRAHAAFVYERGDPEVARALEAVGRLEPGYAPLLFLLDEKLFADRTTPKPVAATEFAVDGAGAPARLRVTAVRQFLGRERVLVSFVDNDRREIFAQLHVDGEYEQLERDTECFVDAALARLKAKVGAVPAQPGASAPFEADVRGALRSESLALDPTEDLLRSAACR